MIKRRPTPTNINFEECNNNNLWEYTPYILKDDTLIIDDQWYASLTSYTKRLLESRLKKQFKLDSVPLPHEYQIDNKQKQLTTIYHTYIDGFDYHVWYNPINGPQNVKMIHIPDLTKKIMLDIYEKKRTIQDLKLETLKRKIQKHMIPKTKYFVRLSSTSGKNEKLIKPFTDANDVLEHITSVKLFVDREYSRDKDTYLILVPWINKIDPRCEFRIFVVDRRLTAASPQRYWELHQHSQEEI